MNDAATLPAAAPPAGEEDTIEEFLGTKQRPRWRRTMKFWLPALLLGLVLIVARCASNEEGPKYITEPVASRSLDLTVSATGNLRPTNQVEVGSEVSGRIDRILVDVNDRVAQGQVLAVINTDTIRDQITQGQASVNAARAQVAQARATLDVDQAQLRRLRDVFRASGGRGARSSSSRPMPRCAAIPPPSPRPRPMSGPRRPSSTPR